MKQPTQHAYTIIIAGLRLTVFVLAMALSAQLLQPKGLATCGSFASRADIIEAYNNGNTNLDRDHDGIPCEGRL